MDQANQKPSQTPQERSPVIQPTAVTVVASKVQPHTPSQQHPALILKACLGLTLLFLAEERGHKLNPSFWLGK